MSINHRDETERLLVSADTSIAAALEASLPMADQQHAAVITGILTNRAIGHALIAQGETATADVSSLRGALITWRRIVSHAVAWNLSFAESDEQHEQWLELAEQLRKAGLDISADVDQITPNFGKDPRGVWKPPSAWRKEGSASDPWSDVPAEGADTAGRREQALRADPAAWEYLGHEIRKAREKRGMSRRALSEAADVSVTSIQNAEDGRAPVGRWPQSLNRITDALGMGSTAALDMVLADPSKPPF
ncbi:helix-turn-helix domain-containing protein [Streptomyces sp. NPDC093223]|uniref:helix-turn-helix domain-containing protein n=1 Tax=Streptomyces sp. NPDC093223 TaxID=3366033 RepID=UPI00381E1959